MKNTTAMADYELRHIEALRKDLAGCTVLLKKDGSFPLEKPCTLAAYGSGVRRTIRGGTGSGEVNSRYTVTIEEGLQQAGFTLTGMEWHTGYEQAREKAHKAFLKQLKKDAKAAKQNFILYGMGKVMPEPEYDLPLNAEGDAAIYVVSRISGEGNDRTPLKGDIRLTDSEVRDILALDKKFTRFMLVLNVGGVVDLSPVMSVRNILLLSQLGVETGGALADILLGKANPSGKLTTTWAAFEEYPEMPDFEDMNETRYREGIYVGYRYFDTFRKKALFPFGYGLSYTEFRLGTAGVEANGAQVTVRTIVENTGTMAGRQVVQVYLSKPAGKLDVPRQELCAFAKTRTLAPGEAETVTCSFTLPEMAAYDAETAAYILEAGDHLVRVGVSSAETVPAAVLHLGKTVTTMQAKNVLGSTDFTDLTAPAAAMERPEGVPVIEIDPASIVCETIDYARTEEILPEVDALTKEDAALLLIGNFDPNAKGFASMIGTAGRHVCGAAGESCSTVKGIPWLVMADGPAGLRLAKEYYEDGKGKHAVGNASVPDSIMEMLSGPMKLVMSLMGGNGKPKAGCEIKTQYCTAIPIGTALAQSFDTDFVQRCGGICRQGCQRAALDGLHDDKRYATFFGQLIAPVTGDLLGTVVPVQIIVLQLAEIPRLVAQNILKPGRVVMAGKPKVPDASCGLLLPQPVHKAHGFCLFVPGLVQGVQQVEVDVVHAQPLQLLFKNALGIVQIFAVPQRHFGGKIKAAAVPFGDHAAHEGLTLAVVIGIGGIKVVDTGGLSGVQQSFGALFVNGAVSFGGKTHTAVTQKGSADVVFVPVAVFHKLSFCSRGG